MSMPEQGLKPVPAQAYRCLARADSSCCLNRCCILFLEQASDCLVGPSHCVACAGLWSEGQELVVDPAKSGNALRFINDCIGMPKGQTKSVATVEVFDFATLRPHIFFFTVAPVKANQELLMDYGEVRFPPSPSLSAVACSFSRSLLLRT